VHLACKISTPLIPRGSSQEFCKSTIAEFIIESVDTYRIGRLLQIFFAKAWNFRSWSYILVIFKDNVGHCSQYFALYTVSESRDVTEFTIFCHAILGGLPHGI